MQFSNQVAVFICCEGKLIKTTNGIFKLNLYNGSPVKINNKTYYTELIEVRISYPIMTIYIYIKEQINSRQ